MLLKTLLAGLFLTLLSACDPSSSDKGPATPPPSQQTEKSTPAQPEEIAPDSLKSELDQGRTLVLTIVDSKLASDINDRMGTRNLVTLQGGKEVTLPDSMKNSCQIGSDRGFVNSGDQFQLKTTDVQDKISLAARQVYFRVSSYLGIQCRKGGMDQSEMTLEDLSKITGSSVKFELTE